MESALIAALVLVIPFALLPVAFAWYRKIGRIYTAIKEAREKKGAREKAIRAVAEDRRK